MTMMALNLTSTIRMGMIKNSRSHSLEILRFQRRLFSLIHPRKILRKGQHKRLQRRQRKIFRRIILIGTERVPENKKVKDKCDVE